MYLTNQSEVAQLLEQIQTQYQAAYNGLHGFATVARHRIRTARTEQISRLHEELQSLVGDEQAIQLVSQTLDQL